MLSLLVCVALGAAPVDAPIKLAAPGLSYVNVPEKTGDFFNDHFAQQVMLHGRVRVTTRNEISSLLGFERQKQLLGCSDASNSCLAELAGALGVDALITGSIGKFSGVYAVNLKIISTANARPLAIYSGRLKGDEALLDWLGARGEELNGTLRALFPATAAKPPREARRVEAPPPSAEPMPDVAPPEAVAVGTPSPGSKAWITAVVGGALVVGGIAAMVGASGSARYLTSSAASNDTFERMEAVAGQGKTLEVLGWTGVGLGGAALGVAGGMWLFGGKGSAQVALLPGGAAVSVAGVLP